MSDPIEGGDKMSEREKAQAEYIGQVVMSRLLDAAADKDLAGRVIDTWSGELQRIVGRAVIRTVLWVCGVVLFIAALKLGLVDRIGGMLGVPK